MISTILSLSFTNSTATNAKPPAFALCASWLMLLASPTSLRIASASCLFSRGMTSAEITACRTYSLMRTPASPARFLCPHVYSPLEKDMPCISSVCPFRLNWIVIPFSANLCYNCCQLRDLPISFFTAVYISYFDLSGSFKRCCFTCSFPLAK